MRWFLFAPFCHRHRGSRRSLPSPPPYASSFRPAATLDASHASLCALGLSGEFEVDRGNPRSDRYRPCYQGAILTPTRPKDSGSSKMGLYGARIDSPRWPVEATLNGANSTQAGHRTRSKERDGEEEKSCADTRKEGRTEGKPGRKKKPLDNCLLVLRPKSASWVGRQGRRLVWFNGWPSLPRTRVVSSGPEIN